MVYEIQNGLCFGFWVVGFGFHKPLNNCDYWIVYEIWMEKYSIYFYKSQHFLQSSRPDVPDVPDVPGVPGEPGVPDVPGVEHFFKRLFYFT
jgi:hypothetical protein